MRKGFIGRPVVVARFFSLVASSAVVRPGAKPMPPPGKAALNVLIAKMNAIHECEHRLEWQHAPRDSPLPAERIISRARREHFSWRKFFGAQRTRHERCRCRLLRSVRKGNVWLSRSNVERSRPDRLRKAEVAECRNQRRYAAGAVKLGRFHEPGTEAAHAAGV